MSLDALAKALSSALPTPKITGIASIHPSPIEKLVMAHGDDFGLQEWAGQLRRIYKESEAPGNE